VRIAYYRQLQAISDNVAHPEIHGSVEEEIESLERRQTEETAVVKGLQHHLQYLDNLCNEHDETKIPEQMCPICHMPIAERGLLTPCNHLFCEWYAENLFTYLFFYFFFLNFSSFLSVWSRGQQPTARAPFANSR